MEEHDDPHHPIVAVAKERITELSTRRKTTEDTIRTTETQSQTLQAHEIESALNAIPDLRDTLKSPTTDAPSGFVASQLKLSSQIPCLKPPPALPSIQPAANRGARIRTGDLTDPNGARYQAAPRPDAHVSIPHRYLRPHGGNPHGDP
jgi:hypothetical protein